MPEQKSRLGVIQARFWSRPISLTFMIFLVRQTHRYYNPVINNSSEILKDLDLTATNVPTYNVKPISGIRNQD